MTIKVSSIEIQGFRGVPDLLTLDFRPKHNEPPVSFILFGDNGTGKSSVVDAFEFVLQGRIARKSGFLRGLIPAAVNYSQTRICQVKAILTDATTVTRSVSQDVEGRWVTDRRPHPRFTLSPFVLRREDILSFWTTPVIQRQTVFFGYLMDTQGSRIDSHTIAEEIERLSEERYALKEERRGAARQLAEIVRIPVEDIPLGRKGFQSFVCERLQGGMSRRELRRLPPDIRTLLVDHQADRVVKTIRSLTERVDQLQCKISTLKALPSQKLDKSTLRDVLTSASNSITQAFLRISPAKSFIDSIEIIQGIPSEVALSIDVRLRNGMSLEPEKVFSEANLDLLALIIFLAFAKESAKRGQAKLLILDDVLQSVDASIRLVTTDYILDEFSDWQLVFTVHDRLWLEQLRELFRQRNMPFLDGEILRWQFELGPSIILGSRDIDFSLRRALEGGDVISICAQSGLLLERISSILSYRLPISVTRRRGDKYTLGDLWPGVFKVLSKTECAATAGDVNRWLHLRNLVGAHYNEWAQGLSLQEAYQFGEAVARLLDAVRCDNCYRWIERIDGISGPQPVWACRCGRRRLVARR